MHRALELRPATVLSCWRTATRCAGPSASRICCCACEADARGRTGREQEPYPQAAYLRAALATAAAVTLSAAERTGLPGPAIGEELRRRRLAALTTLKAAAAREQNA